MFCVNCGVRLADTEKQCPLCDTVVYHPALKREAAAPLYPPDRIPKTKARSKAFNGAILILFFIPMFISFLSDWQTDGRMSWAGFVAGALIVGYVVFALPLWFRRPNPVIFVPCGFAAAALYLLYIDLVTGGSWFLSFAFPVTGGFCLITCAVVTLLYYVRKGKLYIWGGAFILAGAFMVLMEYLMSVTFELAFIGWSLYPLVALAIFGGMLIFLAINRSAREMMERKLFF